MRRKAFQTLQPADSARYTPAVDFSASPKNIGIGALLLVSFIAFLLVALWPSSGRQGGPRWSVAFSVAFPAVFTIAVAIVGFLIFR